MKIQNTATRAVDDEDVGCVSRIIDEIGISGLLIAAAEACERRAKKAKSVYATDAGLGNGWWNNANTVTEASEQVSDF